MEKLRYERPIINKINLGMPEKFGYKTKFEPITEIDGVKVSELIAQHGSPLFVISEKTVRNTIRDAKRAFNSRYPKVQFAWSYKTNYLDAVCQIHHQEGSWAEVVSIFEYNKAIQNGVSGKNIIFNGPDKSEEDLTTAINNGSLIHIDHFDELYMVIDLAGKLKETPRVAVRVNMDTGIYPIWDRFGFNYENGDAWIAISRIMINHKIDLVGLHAHIGTYMMSATPYHVAASKLCELAVKIKKQHNYAIKYIDIGGGFASKNTLKGAYLPGSDTNPTFDDYAEEITNAIIESDIEREDLPTLILETGRALIDDAGWLIGSVIANKRTADGRRSMIINIGVNILFTAFWYDHTISPAQPFSTNTEDITICGPLCMNIDVIRSSIRFPVLKRGDYLVVSRVGAYNMTQWMQFITLRPNVVLIDANKKVHVIRKKESNQNFSDMEVTPEHLKGK
jgi:diaminopimelate decarboxylase